jgi:hypothetical protein
MKIKLLVFWQEFKDGWESPYELTSGMTYVALLLD